VTFHNNSQNPSAAPRTVTFNIGTSLAAANGHFYSFVSASGVKWNDAKNAAAALSLYGLQGYMATVTSQAENDFILAKVQGNGWLGGTDQAVEGQWRWVTGPENGQLFSYANWDSGEPNNCCGGEHFVHMLGNPGFGSRVGKWNDLYDFQDQGDLYRPLGYVVEYGGMPGDPSSIQLSGNVTVHVVPVNDPPTVAANALSVVVNEGQTAINAGSYSYIDSASVAISASIGNVTKTGAANGTWSWSYVTTDGPPNSGPVTITANDGNGGTAIATFQLTVNNVAPTLNITGTNSVYYTDWTAANVGGGTASGVITLPDASTISVSLSTSGGGFFGAQTNGGTNYWVPSAPYISAQVPNAPPDSDIIQIQGGTNTVYTVTVSQPIVDPIMSILSLGSGPNTITYDFNAPFTIVSQGSGFWGGCSTCLRIRPGDVLEGQEGHGTIKFLGTYSSFSWTVPNPEVWHGFTFAVRSTQALAQTVIVDEGQTATNNGTWGDVPADTVLVTSSVGSVVTNPDGTWSWSFPTSDGPVQSQTVTITASDEDGGVTQKTFPLVVNNVAPTITAKFQVAPIPEASVSTSGNLVVQATDPAGSNDPLVYEFDCDNNGSYETPAHPSTSAADCYFPDNGSYPVPVRVSDGDGGVATGTITAIVTNVAPTATAFGSVINENGLATVNGTIFDPSPVDTFTVTITWGPGEGSTVLSLPAGSTSYSATHQYLEDNPTATPSDTYPVGVSVKDDDNGVGTATTSVTVNNVAPFDVSIGMTAYSFFENSTVTLNGMFKDPGTQDTHTVVIDWGAGETSTTLTLAAGQRTFSASHQYMDDNPTTTPADGLTVRATVTDDDGGAQASALGIVVRNAAPSITATGSIVDENGTATASGSINDPGSLDTFTVIITWGPGEGSTVLSLPAGSTSYSAMHQYLDDNPSGTAADAYAISVTAMDDDTGVGAASTTVTVRNVPPSVTATNATIFEGGTASIMVAVADIGSLDTCTLTINWGEGPTEVYSVACNGSVDLSHQYLDDNPTATAIDDYDVVVTVTDDDTGVGSAGATVTVINVDPVVSASAAPNPQYWGLNVNFIASATDVGTQDTHTFAWDFGDTNTGAGASIAHAYANPGLYTATATATDDDTGSDSWPLAISIKKRETSLVYTGQTSSTFGFGTTLSAKLSDAVVSGAPIGGRTVTFTLNAVNYAGTTAVSGQTNDVSAIPLPPLMPGTYTISLSFAGDTHYLPSSATATLTITNSVGCKITAGTLRSANNGRGGFNVQATGATTVKGELQFQNNSINFHAPNMTALGCSPDGKKGWFAGTGKNGDTFLAHVEDNGEPGSNDIFKIWVNGVARNGNGALTGGNVQIHKP